MEISECFSPEVLKSLCVEIKKKGPVIFRNVQNIHKTHIKVMGVILQDCLLNKCMIYVLEFICLVHCYSNSQTR